ncbi:NAD-dependent epimerase/dehydratase family protein [Lentilactobacillus sp. SPB1-3]|uniref:NAD-dependent epimerase/dehydratase family protein n=1 Tax=Lentilactobacillus terminaliae TaxID=3003483 RepID=A0ACD5DFY6_9LACO|nr:NAD-dependent epimerase/dehydratase family protein [Lentilactobacillus sp. SPB1-3]MCZ0976488.1 NAD-dependent epimerase/dehydratase family protein [Lentilactobacillus sp. SPB1-3]
MTENILVTGANGFLGIHVIAELLTKGYNVRATLRDLAKSNEVIATLKNNQVPNITQLSFAKADLSADDGWSEAMSDIDRVISVASPVFMTIPDNPDEMGQAATDGILKILKVAIAANVKQVVMTANFGAVGFSNLDKHSITTEADWTDPKQSGLSLYEKSKLIAEKAAWDYMQGQDTDLQFTTINPVAILGPSMNDHTSGSFGIIKNIMDGSTNYIPNINLNVVDVRDVASIHVAVLGNQNAYGQRFIASSEGSISMPEIATLVKQQRPDLAGKIAKHTMPNWIIKSLARFNRTANEGKLMLEMNRNVSVDKAKRLLDWQATYSKEEAVLAAVDTLVRTKQV